MRIQLYRHNQEVMEVLWTPWAYTEDLMAIAQGFEVHLQIRLLPLLRSLPLHYHIHSENHRAMKVLLNPWVHTEDLMAIYQGFGAHTLKSSLSHPTAWATCSTFIIWFAGWRARRNIVLLTGWWSFLLIWYWLAIFSPFIAYYTSLDEFGYRRFFKQSLEFFRFTSNNFIWTSGRWENRLAFNNRFVAPCASARELKDAGHPWTWDYTRTQPEKYIMVYSESQSIHSAW